MLVLVLIFLLLECISAQRPASLETKVLRFLLSESYDKSNRPVIHETDTTLLNISVNLFTLYNVDQAKEVFEFSAEFVLSWFDPLIYWNLSEYNLTWIKMKEKYIWTPDILVSTSIKTKLMLHDDDRYVDIRYDGYVQQSYYGLFLNQCKIKVNLFPYDVQECVVEIGPWSYTGNSEWDFVYMIPDICHETDLDAGLNYTTLLWKTMMQRKPQFYIWVLLVPTFIITTIALFGIFNPTNHEGERQEKVTLGLTTLLSTAVLLQIVVSTMPKSTVIPLLGNFILAEILITASGVLCSVAVLTMHQRALSRRWRPPAWLVRACEWPFRSTHFNSMNTAITAKSDTDSSHKNVNDCALVAEMEEMMSRMNQWLEEEHLDKQRSGAWAIISNRVHMYLAVLFQVANIVLTVKVTS